jgi:hypothetical protein
MVRSTVLALGAVIAALVVTAAAGAAGGASAHAEILTSLNAERAANGIPSDVRENPKWSAECAKHVAYLDATGVLSHTEDPASPAYSAGGSWAGANSVLAMGTGWANGDPFAMAPLHLAQLMSPELHSVGLEVSGNGTVCMTTFPGYVRLGVKKPTVFSVPGDGATGVPYAEVANELPFVPSDFVGLQHGARTGFNIMVFAEGLVDPWNAHIASAALAGPGGPVAVRTVDRTSPTIGAYLPPGGGFLIPVAPLAPGTTYTASVRFASGRARRTWHFTTAR